MLPFVVMKVEILVCFLFLCSFVLAVNQLDESIPLELFDIRMDLESSVLESSSELEAVVTYESFGLSSTRVDLDYSIYDENGEKVYNRLDEVVVSVEEIRRIHFNDLNLEPGEYTFVFKTVYNVDVFDDFRQKFTVREKGFWERFWEWLGF